MHFITIGRVHLEDNAFFTIGHVHLDDNALFTIGHVHLDDNAFLPLVIFFFLYTEYHGSHHVYATEMCCNLPRESMETGLSGHGARWERGPLMYIWMTMHIYHWMCRFEIKMYFLNWSCTLGTIMYFSPVVLRICDNNVLYILVM